MPDKGWNALQGNSPWPLHPGRLMHLICGAVLWRTARLCCPLHWQIVLVMWLELLLPVHCAPLRSLAAEVQSPGCLDVLCECSEADVAASRAALLLASCSRAINPRETKLQLFQPFGPRASANWKWNAALTMAITRQLPILPIELMEAYSDQQIPLYHPVRGTTCIKQLNRLSIMLKQEVMLLQKIRYKQKNQHKSATWWRHVSGSQRVALRLLEQLNDSFIPNLPTAEWVSNTKWRQNLQLTGLCATETSSLSFLVQEYFGSLTAACECSCCSTRWAGV